MVLHWKRRLLLGLGLAMTFGWAVALPATASAQSTLTGETLSGSSSQGNTWSCAPSFRVSGAATAPYPGTFSESGDWNQSGRFAATFTIVSGTTTITGSKGPQFFGGAFCQFAPPGTEFSTANGTVASYTATIHTPSGNFHDEGTSSVSALVRGSGSATLTESFTSSLAAPVLIVPTSKSQCKKGGWRDFDLFKNQGDCVSFVATKGKNPPSGSANASVPAPKGKGHSGK
jgi:hypothetical protein